MTPKCGQIDVKCAKWLYHVHIGLGNGPMTQPCFGPSICASIDQKYLLLFMCSDRWFLVLGFWTELQHLASWQLTLFAGCTLWWLVDLLRLETSLESRGCSPIYWTQERRFGHVLRQQWGMFGSTMRTDYLCCSLCFGKACANLGL